MRRQLETFLLAVVFGALICGDLWARDLRLPRRSETLTGAPPPIVGQRSPRFKPSRRIILLHPHIYYRYGIYPYEPHYYEHALRYPDLYPFFCFFDGVAFVNQAGFLDHVAGTHKVPLDLARNFCTDNGASCWFGY